MKGIRVSLLMILIFALPTYGQNKDFDQAKREEIADNPTQPVEQLGKSLGPIRLREIIGAEFVKFAERRAERPIYIEQEFWRTLTPLVANTDGPIKNADVFLREGFAAFLDDYQADLIESDEDRKALRFIKFTLDRYINRGCRRSPCKVPPCCGDGIVCYKCKRK